MTLFFCLLINMFGYALVVGQFSIPNEARIAAGSVLSSFTAGLLAARICGSASKALFLLCAVIAVESLFAIVGRLIGVDTFQSGNLIRASGTYEGPFSLYKVLVICIPISIAYGVTGSLSYVRSYWLLLTGLASTALLLTWYRAPILATVSTALWLLDRLQVSKRVKYSAALLGFIVVTLTVCVRVSDSAGLVSSHRSVLSRPILWKKGWDVFVSKPLTGIGVGGLRFNVITKAGNSVTMRSPHNQLIFVLAEAGIVGGATLLLSVISLVKTLRSSRTPIYQGLAASWIVIGISGFTETIWGVGELSYLPINCALGMLMGSVLLLRRQEDSNIEQVLNSFTGGQAGNERAV